MAVSASPVSLSARSLGRHLLRSVRGVATVSLVPLAALGAVTAPQASLLLGAVFAALTGALVHSVRRGAAVDLPPLPHPAVAAVAMAPLPAAVAGAAVFGLGLLATAGGTLGLVVAVAWWGGSCPALPPERTAPGDDPAPDDGSLRALLRAVPLDVLFDEWRSTAGSVVPAGAEASGRGGFPARARPLWTSS
jgi:hypothetical protein